MNLYRGCMHNCIYCDGRDEKYRVEGDFGKDITIKINAPSLLHAEIKKIKKHGNVKHGFFLLGGGVNDSYQPVEEKYRITREALSLLADENLPVHILTKSTLVKRDIDLIKNINSSAKAIVSFSFSSIDREISSYVEPGVQPPSERLKVIEELKKNNIPCGMFLMPVIPFLTDSPEKIYDSLRAAKNYGIDFVIFGGMTLKSGRQKDYFFNALAERYPDLLINYDVIYGDNKWGQANNEYYNHVNSIFLEIATQFKLPIRIPPSVFRDVVDENSLVVIILEQLDYLHKIRGYESTYGYAASQISKLKEPIVNYRDDLRAINGIGKITERIIKEIIDWGRSTYYENLLHYRTYQS